MTTEGIEAVFLETHNWGKAAKFFQSLGFELEFETDHNSASSATATVPTSSSPRSPRTGSRVCRSCARWPTPTRSAPIRRRGGHPVRGDALRDQGDDRPRPRRPALEPPGPGPARSAESETPWLTSRPRRRWHRGAGCPVAGHARPG